MITPIHPMTQTNAQDVQFGALRGKNFRGSGQGVSFVEKNDKGGQGIADDDVVIVAASRTPFGRYNGSLSGVNAPTLAYASAKKTLADAGIDAKELDASIWGHIVPTTAGDAYLPRTVGLMLGMRDGTTSKVVQRRCASGFSALEEAAMEVASGKADVVLAGGVEIMSKGPLANFDLPKQAAELIKGVKTGKVSMEDAGQQWNDLWKPQGMEPPVGFESMLQGGLTDPYKDMPMTQTADNLAREKGLDRNSLDALSVESHKRAFRAMEEGRFNYAPVTQDIVDEANAILKAQSVLPKGMTEFLKDEGPRESTLEKLNSLRALHPDGLHTAASASQITDGASSVIMTSGAYAKKNNLQVLAKVRAIGNAGVKPEIMGHGPVPAMKIAFDVDGHQNGDKMDVIEINEAFAAVPETAIRELNLDRKKVNPNGSGISLGHPLAATGARIVTDLVHELKRVGGQFGVGSACIGGGEGAAIIVENVNAAASPKTGAVDKIKSALSKVRQTVLRK